MRWKSRQVLFYATQTLVSRQSDTTPYIIEVCDVVTLLDEKIFSWLSHAWA